MRFSTLRLWLGCALLTTYSLSTAQLVVTSLGQSITVDFDSSTPGVCDGPIQGTGFTPAPTSGSGMLDSDLLAFEGLVDPASMDFGGTATTGDAARGISSDPTNGSGFYAFEPSGGTGRAFGFQPSTTHFNPGTMTFKFTNQTGFAINEFSFGVDIYLLGNSNRSTNLNFGFSLDGVNFIRPSAEGFNTPEATIPSFFGWIGPGFSDDLSINQDVCLPDPIPNNTSVFIRFFIQDTGVGTDATGDVIAFDNISFGVSDRAFCAATDVTDATVSRSNNDTEATVNWTNPAGCFDEVIVVARAVQAVTTNISDDDIDGFPLSAFDPTTNINANWSSRSTDNEVAALSQGAVGTAGEDYFVYKGTGTSATITNLDPSTEYHFRVLAVASGCDWAKGLNVVSERALATQLINFQTSQHAQNIELNWQAIHDAAHQATIVERSTDGVNFSTIATVLATTRHAVTRYTIVDEQPEQGWNYYRLKLLDEDGTFNYSPVRTVQYHSLAAIELTPIYAENRLVVHQLPTDVKLDYSIYNYVGQRQSAGILDTHISLSNLAKGGYIMVINNEVTIPFVWQ